MEEYEGHTSEMEGHRKVAFTSEGEVSKQILTAPFSWPYYPEHTWACLILKAKQSQASLVLGWETTPGSWTFSLCYCEEINFCFSSYSVLVSCYGNLALSASGCDGRRTQHGREELPQVRGQGQRLRVPGCYGTGTAERNHPTNEARVWGREDQPTSKEQWLRWRRRA